MSIGLKIPYTQSGLYKKVFASSVRCNARLFISDSSGSYYCYHCREANVDLQDRGGCFGPTDYRIATGGETVGAYGSDSTWVMKYIYGTIETGNYYTIASSVDPSDGSGGTAIGGGNVWEGESTSITATPNAGWVIKSWSDGDVSGVGGSTAITRNINNVNADSNLVVTFEKYYNIVFDASGGQNPPATINKCVAYRTYTIPSAIPTREGYKFDGWATSSGSTTASYLPGQTYSVSSVATAGMNVTLYAVWSQAELSYDANGGSPTPASVSYYGNVTLASAISKTGRDFVGWLINGTVYQAGASYTLTETTIATAQWSTISFFNDDVTKGTISLLDVTTTSHTIVATQNSSGYVIFSGVKNHRYRLLAEVSDILYKEKGVLVDGSYIPSYEFTYTSGDVNGTFYYEAKNLYTVDVACSPQSGGTAAITYPESPDTIIGDVGYYVENRRVVITATPAVGSEMLAYNIIDTDTGYSRADGTSSPVVIAENQLTFNVLATIVFSRIKYSISASKDDSSSSVISGITITKDGIEIDEAEYGDGVLFSATVANGYSFDGWYLNGIKVSSSASYMHTMIGNVHLVAKAKVSITINLDYRDNRQPPSQYNESCHITVNSDDFTSFPHTFDVVLGEGFDYVLTLGEIYSGAGSWNFNAWFDASDTSKSNPLQYEQNGTITPTTAMSIVAEVTSATVENTLTIVIKNDEDDSVIDPTGMGGVVALTPAPSSSSTTKDGISFTYNGSKSVRMSAMATIVVGEEVLAFSAYKDGLTTISEDADCGYVVNKTKTIYAYYGSQGERTITITYGLGNRSMGTFALDGVSNDDGEASISVTKTRGEAVNIVAKPKNGYKFVGWYLDPSCLGDPFRESTNATMVVVTQRTLYAYFKQDTNAIYEWEGSSANKVFTWQSKQYVSSRPMNPSAMRIDTQGYPVSKFEVQMYSSPDSAPTAVTTLLDVASQDCRRLPVRRMERYLQVKVENDQEVDAIFIGTSMGGLAV